MCHMVLGAALLRPITFYTEQPTKKQKNKRKSRDLTLCCTRRQGAALLANTSQDDSSNLTGTLAPPDLGEFDLTNGDSGFIYDDEMFQNQTQNEAQVPRVRHNSVKSESEVNGLRPHWKSDPDCHSNSSAPHLTDLSAIKRMSGHYESEDILDYNKPLYTSTGSVYFMPHQEPNQASNGSLHFLPNSYSTPYRPTTRSLTNRDGRESNSKSCCGWLRRCCSCCHGEDMKSHDRKSASQSAPMFDWSLFTNLLFVSYVVGICCGNCGYVNIFLFIPPLADDIGLSKNQSALLLSIAGMCRS